MMGCKSTADWCEHIIRSSDLGWAWCVCGSSCKPPLLEITVTLSMHSWENRQGSFVEGTWCQAEQSLEVSVCGEQLKVSELRADHTILEMQREISQLCKKGIIQRIPKGQESKYFRLVDHTMRVRTTQLYHESCHRHYSYIWVSCVLWHL